MTCSRVHFKFEPTCLLCETGRETYQGRTEVLEVFDGDETLIPVNAQQQDGISQAQKCRDLNMQIVIFSHGGGLVRGRPARAGMSLPLMAVLHYSRPPSCCLLVQDAAGPPAILKAFQEVENNRKKGKGPSYFPLHLTGQRAAHSSPARGGVGWGGLENVAEMTFC